MTSTLVAEPLRAYRRVRFYRRADGAWRFRSLAVSGTFAADEEEAVCQAGSTVSPPRTRHAAPDVDCRCGWYAVADPADLPRAIGLTPPGCATLEVALSGVVQMWEVRGGAGVGYRAERQQVIGGVVDGACHKWDCPEPAVGVSDDGWPECGGHGPVVPLADVAGALGIDLVWGTVEFVPDSDLGRAAQEFADAFQKAMETVAMSMAEMAESLAKLTDVMRNLAPPVSHLPPGRRASGHGQPAPPPTSVSLHLPPSRRGSGRVGRARRPRDATPPRRRG